MNIQLSNRTIYIVAQLLNKQFLDDSTALVLPVTVNFPLQKNIKVLTDAAEIIEKARLDIGKKYGTVIADGYDIAPDKREQAQQELNDLFKIDQVLDIQKIPLSALSNVALTTQQMQALLFMIEDD